MTCHHSNPGCYRRGEGAACRKRPSSQGLHVRAVAQLLELEWLFRGLHPAPQGSLCKGFHGFRCGVPTCGVPTSPPAPSLEEISGQLSTRWGSRAGADSLPSVSFEGGILALEIPVLVVSWALIHWTHLELSRLVSAGVGMTFYPHFGQQGPGPYPPLP